MKRMLAAAGMTAVMLFAAAPRADAGVEISIGIPLPGIVVYEDSYPPPVVYAPPAYYYPPVEYRSYYGPPVFYGYGDMYWHGGGWRGGHRWGGHPARRHGGHRGWR